VIDGGDAFHFVGVAATQVEMLLIFDGPYAQMFIVRSAQNELVIDDGDAIDGVGVLGGVFEHTLVALRHQMHTRAGITRHISPGHPDFREFLAGDRLDLGKAFRIDLVDRRSINGFSWINI